MLSRAEELDVIPLLDEGDSLLGTRTEVRSANDRYANLETNYLLQRLENYEGIVIVTTNLGDQIDRAFQRRMNVAVEFARPGADERRKIWKLHLPESHHVEREFLDEIAKRLPFTGGQIHNTVSCAALRALENGAERVRRWHLADAIHSECRESGIIQPIFDCEREKMPGSGVGFLMQ